MPDVPALEGTMQQLKRFFPLIAGILFTVLIVFSVLRSGGTPGTNESPAKILAWYQVTQDKNKVSSAGFLTAWGVIAGFAFFGCLFARLRGKSPVLAAVGLAGAAIFAVGGLLSAGAYLSLGDTPSIMTASTAQTLNFLQSDLSYPFIIAGLSIFYLATAVAILRTKPIPIPRTWGWITVVFAAVSLTAFFSFFAFIGTAVWVVVSAVLLTIQNNRDNPAQAQPIPSLDVSGLAAR
jgi:glucan phosphoethanolaminetransferase (alkaline phosphatase superfamily)